MSRAFLFLALPCLLCPAILNADSLGGGAFTMDFVDIGNTTNVDDNTGYGGVDYTYRMGVNEVSESMIGVYNAQSDGPEISFDSNGPNRAARDVSWNEAARFVNWLNTSSGYSAAYNFSTGGANDNIALWTGGNAGFDASNPFRNSNAHYFLPSEDEWYKAAYYDPSANGGTGGYWDFATGSDSAPTAVAGGTSGAVYKGQLGAADITNAGGLSPYGTMAQNGNVTEWSESGFDSINDAKDEPRVLRGGDFATSDALNSGLRSSNRDGEGPMLESGFIGFRVAAVPEPSAVLLLVFGGMGLVLRRKRPIRG